ncbi:hypothetical protein SBA1_590007 [Candidatus Sulfotelmatobacter kueseliae]|uniref:Uncharacterized protein n=1 Tax=Candidatus Sulfotelmatobacter kueseliae TaxID=2042962 RepID=A0A2U3L060_9BACT|nr:hypothetical protein SBA1_590007 [Candidatus Sulfotelmatobacter kueseliae]
MLDTTYKGRSFLHRELWRVVEMQGEIAEERQGRGAFYNHLVAMVFALHAVEAYLNFIGELLAPDIWRDERRYFRKAPYRGFEGKVRKVLELVSLPWAVADRPLKTVLELKELRDLIAHPKTEQLCGSVQTPGNEVPSVLAVPTTLSKIVTAEACAVSIHDVEEFLDNIHTAARPQTDDIWFGPRALRGVDFHVGGSSTYTKDWSLTAAVLWLALVFCGTPSKHQTPARCRRAPDTPTVPAGNLGFHPSRCLS